jgi:hypothetical protein
MAKMLIALSRELYGEKKGLSMKVAGKKFLETIDWKDAQLEDDEFVIEMFPESSLPSSPRGRLQTISELSQAGYISKERSLELLDFPDPSQVTAVWYDVHKFAFNERNFNNNAWVPLFFPPFVRYRVLGRNTDGNWKIVMMPAQSAAGTYQIWWYPKAPVLSGDSDHYDDTQYWWDYVVVDAAIKMLAKEESDVSVLLAQKEQLKARIQSMAADVDYGEAEQVGSRALRQGGPEGSGNGGFWGF